MSTDLTTPNITILTDPDEILALTKDFDTQLIQGMSAYQIRHFVLNDVEFPTADAKYYQCLKEMYTRHEALVEMQFEYEDLEDDLDIAEADYASLFAENPQSSKREKATLRKTKRKSTKIQHTMDSLRRNAEDTMRELRVFYDLYLSLKEQTTHETYDAQEAATWKERFKNRLYSGQFDKLPPIPEANQIIQEFQKQQQTRQQLAGGPNGVPGGPQGAVHGHPLG